MHTRPANQRFLKGTAAAWKAGRGIPSGMPLRLRAAPMPGPAVGPSPAPCAKGDSPGFSPKGRTAGVGQLGAARSAVNAYPKALGSAVGSFPSTRPWQRRSSYSCKGMGL